MRKPDLRNPSYINYYKHCRDTRSPSQLANHQSNDLQPKSFLIASFRIGIFGKARQIKKKTMLRLILLSFLSTLVASDSSSCERLKATLTYTQEDAPRDLSSVVRWW